MKKSEAQSILSILVIVVISVFGCDNSHDYQYPVTTITHQGFDFSTGIKDTINLSNNDGETINWQPGYAVNPLYPNYTYLWWRNSHLDTVGNLNQTKDMGEVDMASVSQIPSVWDIAPEITPLLVNHTYVAKCKDGYVKFKIISTGNTPIVWPAQIEYYFTSGSSFDH